MALIRTSAIVGSISGSIGGVTFVNARRGVVARHRPNKTKPSSASLLEQQAYFANVTRAWSTLTVEQRSAWNALAVDQPQTNRLGITSAPTGFQIFTRFNLYRLRLNSTLLLDPPENIVGYRPVILDLIFLDNPFYQVRTTIDGAIALEFFLIYGARHFSTVIPAHIANWRLLATGGAAPGPVIGANITSAWLETFGEMELGEAYSVRWQYQNIGFSLAPSAPVIQSGNVDPT